MKFDIRCGDVIRELRKMPADSVHLVVTSPPYWNLRDYQSARWEGGDAACEHVASERRYTGRTAAPAQSNGHFMEAGPENAARLREGRWRESGSCMMCGAVKVDEQIGMEPTFAEFIAKMVEVFREVRRVLQTDA